MTFAAEGYAVLPGPLTGAPLAVVRETVVEAVARVDPGEVRIGSTSARVHGILGRAPALGALLDHAPLLEAAGAIVGGPFRMSSCHGRSLMPGASAEVLHQDVATGVEAWPLAGFILMLDPFTERNGATRFVPGSRDRAELPEVHLRPYPREVSACGAAGSLIVFDGSTWHGHGANATADWRHSVQGAFIPRAAAPAVDFERDLPAEIWRGLSTNAQLLLSRPCPDRNSR